MSNSPNIGNIIISFLTDDDVCSNSYGKHIKDCEFLKKRFNEDLKKPGCSGCKKPALYAKYKNIVRQNIIINPEENND